MIKVEVIENFTLGRFNEITNLVRANYDNYGKLFVGDRFECSKELADYLLGENPLKKAVVRLIEIKPVEDKITSKKNKKKKSNK